MATMKTIFSHLQLIKKLVRIFNNNEQQLQEATLESSSYTHTQLPTRLMSSNLLSKYPAYLWPSVYLCNARKKYVLVQRFRMCVQCAYMYCTFGSCSFICRCSIPLYFFNNIPAWRINIIISIEPIMISWNYRYGTKIFLNFFLAPSCFHFCIFSSVPLSFQFKCLIIHHAHAHTFDRGQFTNWKFNRRVAAT